MTNGRVTPEANMSALHKLLKDDYHCQSYSGRGMYGKHCLGVRLDGENLGNLFATIIETSRDLPRNEVEDICEEVSEFHTDQLGKGTIIYFPQALFVSDDSEDAEEDDDGYECEECGAELTESHETLCDDCLAEEEEND
jgi:hypothetical protein